MPDRRPRRRWGWIVELIVFFVFILGVQCVQSRKAASGMAPALTATALDGSRVDLAMLRGEPVIVHFWATWCGVCSAEAGTVAGVARSHRVITVASDSGGATEVRGHAVTRQMNATTVVDPAGTLSRSWGVSAYPTTFFIDSTGARRVVSTGYTTRLGFWWRSLWTRWRGNTVG